MSKRDPDQLFEDAEIDSLFKVGDRVKFIYETSLQRYKKYNGKEVMGTIVTVFPTMKRWKESYKEYINQKPTSLDYPIIRVYVKADFGEELQFWHDNLGSLTKIIK